MEMEQTNSHFIIFAHELSAGTTGTNRNGDSTTVTSEKMLMNFYYVLAGEMIQTIVHFKYGGSYMESGDGYQWTSKEPRVYSIMVKIPSTEGITYSAFEDMIFKKMGKDKRTTQLKLSYFPFAMGDKFPSYILDDDEVETYLSCKEETRSFLHVEVSIVEVERVPVDSCIALNDEGMESNCIANNAMINYKENREGMESNCIANNAIINYKENGEDEALGEGVVGVVESIPSENVDMDVDDDEDKDWDSEDQYEYEYEDGSEDEDEDGREDGDVDHGIGKENENQYAMEWDDETGIKLDQEFATKFEPQEILQRASHSKSFDYEICNSDTGRYVIKCRGTGCNWYVRVVKQAGGSWKVSRYRNKHTCSRVESSTTIKRRKGTVKLVVEFLKREYPNLTDLPKARSIMAALKDKIGLEVSYWTALRGKREAEDTVRGTPAESYRILHSYLFMLEKANPGSITRCVLGKKSRFKYLFVALGACIEGFAAMRKVIQVDATFLKTGRGGVLAVATAQDPNHHHYPLAFAVLDGENDLSWNWFFTQMRSIVQDDEELVWISDRNGSLIKGLSALYPRAKTGFCMFHLSLNVKFFVANTRKKGCAAKFRELAMIYSEAEFLRKYEEFGRLYPGCVEYLETSVVEGPKKWARCYFPGERYNINTTNSAESLNNVFKGARGNSLLLMMDKIIDKIAEWFNKHRKESAGTSGARARKLVPFVENELSARIEVAEKLALNELNSFMLEYSVIGKDGKSYFVDLKNKSCTCRLFDIDKYPCVHAIAALLKYMKWNERPADIHIHELCSKYYQMDTWALAYIRTIYPVPHQSEWFGIPEHILKSCVFPPKCKKRKGRNQVVRVPSTGEKRRKTSNRYVPHSNLANLLGIDDSSESDDEATQD